MARYYLPEIKEEYIGSPGSFGDSRILPKIKPKPKPKSLLATSPSLRYKDPTVYTDPRTGKPLQKEVQPDGSTRFVEVDPIPLRSDEDLMNVLYKQKPGTFRSQPSRSGRKPSLPVRLTDTYLPDWPPEDTALDGVAPSPYDEELRTVRSRPTDISGLDDIDLSSLRRPSRETRETQPEKPKTLLDRLKLDISKDESRALTDALLSTGLSLMAQAGPSKYPQSFLSQVGRAGLKGFEQYQVTEEAIRKNKLAEAAEARAGYESELDLLKEARAQGKYPYEIQKLEKEAEKAGVDIAKVKGDRYEKKGDSIYYTHYDDKTGSFVSTKQGPADSSKESIDRIKKYEAWDKHVQANFNNKIKALGVEGMATEFFSRVMENVKAGRTPKEMRDTLHALVGSGRVSVDPVKVKELYTALDTVHDMVTEGKVAIGKNEDPWQTVEGFGPKYKKAFHTRNVKDQKKMFKGLELLFEDKPKALKALEPLKGGELWTTEQIEGAMDLTEKEPGEKVDWVKYVLANRLLGKTAEEFYASKHVTPKERRKALAREYFRRGELLDERLGLALLRIDEPNLEKFMISLKNFFGVQFEERYPGLPQRHPFIFDFSGKRKGPFPR